MTLVWSFNAWQQWHGKHNLAIVSHERGNFPNETTKTYNKQQTRATCMKEKDGQWHGLKREDLHKEGKMCTIFLKNKVELTKKRENWLPLFLIKNTQTLTESLPINNGALTLSTILLTDDLRINLMEDILTNNQASI